MADSASDRARVRLREEMARQHLNQVDVAGRLEWTQSRVSKLLTGATDLAVDDLEALCFAVGIRLTEAVRDRGLEFCAEMSPTEMRVLERLRRLPKPIFDAVLTILDIRTSNSQIEPRGATPRRKILGRPRSPGDDRG